MDAFDAIPFEFEVFFRAATGHPGPFPYQAELARRAARGAWPHLLDVPTGLGKTEALICAWLWGRVRAPRLTGRRLVYCLPMRTLVEQTARVAGRVVEAVAPMLERDGVPVPGVHRLLGGDVDEEWERHPERPAVLVGTQDMLLSRALCRGYAMHRGKWPVPFGLLHADVLWVFDEPQLMGVGVETGAQLQALRALLGTYGPSHTVWASATLDPARFLTVDMRRWLSRSRGGSRGLDVLRPGPADLSVPEVRRRLEAARPLERLPLDPDDKRYVKDLALRVLEGAPRLGTTLVVLNVVSRAQQLYKELARLSRRREDPPELLLLHGRLRPADRREREARLLERPAGARIVVATQVVEAGLDISSDWLVTELAPWPSIVQRLGRCNRRGDRPDARASWIPLSDRKAPPYLPADLRQAADLLAGLEDGAPARLREHAEGWRPRREVHAVLRRRDLLEFFDTSPDLLGDDVDVSPFVRVGDDTHVFVAWRAFDPDEGPTAETLLPGPEELARVPVGEFRKFVKKLREAHARSSRRQGRRALLPWGFDPVDRAQRGWRMAAEDDVWPGRVFLLHPQAGGYDPDLGWTGKPGTPVPEAQPPPFAFPAQAEHYEGDPRSRARRWVELAHHLADVRGEASSLLRSLGDLGLPSPVVQAVETAAAWHDVGKAHPAFQAKLVFELPDGVAPPPASGVPWAKAPHGRMMLGPRQRQRAQEELGPEANRPFFRHELASALAWLAWVSGPGGGAGLPPGIERDRYVDLVAYLIAAHHGKVRLSIRSLPDERSPEVPPGQVWPRPYARGVWDGDELRVVEVPGAPGASGSTRLRLDLVQMGPGSWMERMTGLVDGQPEAGGIPLGPFRLGFLEALVRVADWRASAAPSASAAERRLEDGS